MELPSSHGFGLPAEALFSELAKLIVGGRLSLEEARECLLYKTKVAAEQKVKSDNGGRAISRDVAQYLGCGESHYIKNLAKMGEPAYINRHELLDFISSDLDQGSTITLDEVVRRIQKFEKLHPKRRLPSTYSAANLMKFCAIEKNKARANKDLQKWLFWVRPRSHEGQVLTYERTNNALMIESTTLLENLDKMRRCINHWSRMKESSIIQVPIKAGQGALDFIRSKIVNEKDPDPIDDSKPHGLRKLCESLNSLQLETNLAKKRPSKPTLAVLLTLSGLHEQVHQTKRSAVLSAITAFPAGQAELALTTAKLDAGRLKAVNHRWLKEMEASLLAALKAAKNHDTSCEDEQADFIITLGLAKI